MYLHDRIGSHALRRGFLDPDLDDHVAVLGLGRKVYRLDGADPHTGQRNRRASLQAVDTLKMCLQGFGAGEELRAMADSQNREAQDPEPGRDQRADAHARIHRISHGGLASQSS